jgi:hypothetical protein
MYLIVAIFFGFLPIIGLVIWIRRLINKDQQWVEKFLQSGNTLTNFSLNNVSKIADAIRNLFGAVRASQIERFIILQARRGVLQRLLQNEENPKIQRPIEDQLKTVMKKIKGGRVAIGNYCWENVIILIPELSKLVEENE